MYIPLSVVVTDKTEGGGRVLGGRSNKVLYRHVDPRLGVVTRIWVVSRLNT